MEKHRGISAIERLEHSDENDAKKVNNYIWNGSSWERDTGSASSAYDLRLDDTTTANVTYIGKAALTGSAIATSSAVWQVQKIDETTGMIITWADGDSSFNNIWDNRASLTYA